MNFNFGLCWLVLLLACAGVKSSVLEIGGYLIKTLTESMRSSSTETVQTASRKIPIFEGSQRIEKIEDLADGQLCAFELTKKLNQAIISDDLFSIRYWGQHNEGGKGNWRNPENKLDYIEPEIGCHVVAMDFQQAHIICKAMVKGGRVDEKYIFARYWAYLPAGDSEGKLEDELIAKLEGLSSFAGGVRDVCLSKIFDSSAFGARLWSPYHADQSQFDLPFRRDGRQFTCKLVLDPIPLERTEMDPSEFLALMSPSLFYRLAADPYLPFPRECFGMLPAIEPARAEPGNIFDHLRYIVKFFTHYNPGRKQYEFDQILDDSGEPLIIDLKEKLFYGLTVALQTKDRQILYKCDAALPNWTGYQACPGTPACYGSEMCNRMLSLGPDLFISIRGQNSLEVTGRGLLQIVPDKVTESFSGYVGDAEDKYSDETTRGYYRFPERPIRDGCRYQKIHLYSGYFVLIIHTPVKALSMSNSDLRTSKGALFQKGPRPKESQADVPSPEQSIQNLIHSEVGGAAVSSEGSDRSDEGFEQLCVIPTRPSQAYFKPGK